LLRYPAASFFLSFLVAFHSALSDTRLFRECHSNQRPLGSFPCAVRWDHFNSPPSWGRQASSEGRTGALFTRMRPFVLPLYFQVSILRERNAILSAVREWLSDPPSFFPLLFKRIPRSLLPCDPPFPSNLFSSLIFPVPDFFLARLKREPPFF